MTRALALPLPAKRMLTEQEAAAYCGVSVNTFKARVKIPPVRIGNCVRYDVRALDEWADSQGGNREMTADDWLERLDVGENEAQGH